MTQSESLSKEKAIAYCKRLLKNKIYHSDTILNKLKNKYEWPVVKSTMSFLTANNYFNDEKYLQKLSILCIKKGYGNLKFSQMLKQKCIKNNYLYYTYQCEEQAIDNAYLLYGRKFQNFDGDEKRHKLIDKFKYLGFSKEAINYIIEKERI